jgi:hypothetical protein
MAIDPGTEQSASVILESGRPTYPQKLTNSVLLETVRGPWFGKRPDVLAIEMIASYGMRVGREVFETCLWVGRFIEAWGEPVPRLVYRRDVKLFLCQSVRATDSNIRAALLDRFGGKAKAIGSKANPGPLYSLKKDMWSALAVALTAEEQIRIGTL